MKLPKLQNITTNSPGRGWWGPEHGGTHTGKLRLNDKGRALFNKSKAQPVVLSPEQAEDWVKDSVYKNTLYHTTPTKWSSEIEREGFNITKNKVFGRMFGDGVYLSLTKADNDQYLSSDVSAMEIKANIKNPISIKVSSLNRYRDNDRTLPEALMTLISVQYKNKKILEEFLDVRANFDEIYEKAEKKLLNKYGNKSASVLNSKQQEFERKYGNPRETAITETLRRFGFDALIIEANTGQDESHFIGGSQMLVFDPKKVRIIKK